MRPDASGSSERRPDVTAEEYTEAPPPGGRSSYFGTMTALEEPLLSVTLIARDEEDRLPDALASVAFASERWILSIDADEIVSPKRAVEIRASLAATASEASPPAAFRVPIRLEFLGRELRFGRDTVVRPARLYDRTRARFSDDPVHEKILATGRVESLQESVLHRSYRDLAHYLEKLDRYTTLAAEAKWAAGKGGGGFLPARVLWELFDRAVLRLGFLDGSAGLTFATLSSANTILKYLKLREMERAIARSISRSLRYFRIVFADERVANVSPAEPSRKPRRKTARSKSSQRTRAGRKPPPPFPAAHFASAASVV